MTSHTSKKISKNKMKKTINQTNLVPITFGVSISKEKNSKKVSPKQNGVRQKNTYAKILMNSGARALIIHKSYVNENNFITRKISANKWSTVAGSFATSREAKIKFKMSELNVTAHISAPFHMTTKKSKYKAIFCRDFLWEVEIQQDFQNNIIGWQEINLFMKPIDYKMRTHFTIQDSKNVRSATKTVKKILDANYKKVNLKKIVNNLRYLINDKQSLILKLLRTGSEHKIKLLGGAKPYHARPYHTKLFPILNT